VPLRVWVSGSFRHGHPTLSPKISAPRSQVIDHGGVHHIELPGLHELSEGHLRNNVVGLDAYQEMAWR
jgi:hypothetical protein